MIFRKISKATIQTLYFSNEARSLTRINSHNYFHAKKPYIHEIHTCQI